MHIYSQFVFLHTPRTAGTFLAKVFADELGTPVASYERHPGWEAVPPWAKDLPVLVFVRNPWDWYVSWYHYLVGVVFPSVPNTAALQENPWVRLVFGDAIEVVDGRVQHACDFATVVERACGALDLSHPTFVDLLKDGDQEAALVASGYDLYTVQLLKMVGQGLGSERLTIGRFESLYDDLVAFGAKVGLGVTRDRWERLLRRPAVNSHPHPPYRQQYDARLHGVVGAACQCAIERFEYRF